MEFSHFLVLSSCLALSPKVSPFFFPIFKIGPIFENWGENWEKTWELIIAETLDFPTLLDPPDFPQDLFFRFHYD